MDEAITIYIRVQEYIFKQNILGCPMVLEIAIRDCLEFQLGHDGHNEATIDTLSMSMFLKSGPEGPDQITQGAIEALKGLPLEDQRRAQESLDAVRMGFI